MVRSAFPCGESSLHQTRLEKSIHVFYHWLITVARFYELRLQLFCRTYRHPLRSPPNDSLSSFYSNRDFYSTTPTCQFCPCTIAIFSSPLPVISAPSYNHGQNQNATLIRDWGPCDPPALSLFVEVSKRELKVNFPDFPAKYAFLRKLSDREKFFA